MKAMILAAGQGSRMRPLTDDCPKPLLQANGKSIIQYQIEKLVKAGFSEIVINTGYLGEKIRTALGDGKALNCAIDYSVEPESGFETGGGILHAMDKLVAPNQENFLVVNGDIWTDIDYQSLPTKLTGLAHLCLVKNPPHNPEGDFSWDEQSQKVGCGDVRLTFSGVSVLNKHLFDGLNEGVFKLGPLLKTAMAEGAVSGQYHQGQWLDIGTPERLKQFEMLVNNTENNT